MSDLPRKYYEQIAGWIDEQGVYPTPTLILLDNQKLEFCAMAVSAESIINVAFKNCARSEIIEQIVALDTYTQPGQGTTLDSCLILFHLIRGQPARVGVLEYSHNGGEPITKEVRWDNAFWNEKYSGLAAELAEAFR